MADRFEVRELVNESGEGGWAVYDKVIALSVGAWHLDRTAAELEAGVANGES